MMHDDQRLIDFLHDTGLLSRAQMVALQDVAAENGATLYQSLVASGYVPEDDVRRAVAKSWGIPFVSLSPENISPRALFVLPEAFCRAHSLVAYQQDAHRLMLAVLDVASVEVVESLRLPFTIVPHLTDRTSMKRAILHYQELLKDRHAGHIAQLSKAIAAAPNEEAHDIHYQAERLPVQQVVDALFEHALSQSASDIHFEPRATGFMVRYRVGERLYDALQLPLHAARSILARLKLLAKLDLATEAPQEGAFKVSLQYGQDPEQVTLRVATMPVAHDTVPEKMVVRLSRDKEGRSGFMLESLGLHGDGLDRVHRMLRQRQGVLLVCGEEGSGVTTLLYSLLDHKVDPTRSVVVIADVAEVRIPGVTHVRTREDETPLPALIDSAFVSEADVVMVPSCDSGEEARALFRAANEGTFVLTSLPARSASEGLLLLSEVVPSRLLSSVVVGVMATRLVRRLCPRHGQRKLSREELEELEARGADLVKVLDTLRSEGRVREHAQWKDLLFGRATACPECEDGYSGYVGIQEVVSMTATLKDAVQREVSQEMFAVEVSAEGGLSLLEDAVYKAALGLTSIDEVFALTL